METPASDEELMAAFQRGDQSAFEELVRRHQRGVYNFVLRFSGNREVAEEIFQEVFVKLHQAAERYSPQGKFTTWLYTIARNLCVDAFRRKKNRRMFSLEQKDEQTGQSFAEVLAHHDPSPDVMTSASQIEQVLEAALEQLNIEQKEVFLLREKEGFKFEEIAEMSGVSINTVKSRMRYALAALRRAIRQSRYRELLERDDGS